MRSLVIALVLILAVATATLAAYIPPAAYALGYGFPGQPPASGATGNYAILTPEFTITIPANFGPVLNRSTAVHVGTTPTTNPVVFNVSDNGTVIGTITIASSGAVTLATTGGTSKVIAAGHELRVTAPAVQDATLADVSITIAATRA